MLKRLVAESRTIGADHTESERITWDDISETIEAARKARQTAGLAKKKWKGIPHTQLFNSAQQGFLSRWIQPKGGKPNEQWVAITNILSSHGYTFSRKMKEWHLSFDNPFPIDDPDLFPIFNADRRVPKSPSDQADRPRQSRSGSRSGSREKKAGHVSGDVLHSAIPTKKPKHSEAMREMESVCYVTISARLNMLLAIVYLTDSNSLVPQ